MFERPFHSSTCHGEAPELIQSIRSASDGDQMNLAGRVTIDSLHRIPQQSKTAFDSLQGLSNYLCDAFSARLVFVSCRNVRISSSPIYQLDAAKLAFAEERGRLFAADLPFDVEIAQNGMPRLWRPEAAVTTSYGRSCEGINGSSPTLIAVPYRRGELLALCVAQPTESPTEEKIAYDTIAWHCVQYLPEHFLYHSPKTASSRQLLSPQEERIIQKCSEGLTDKEIGSEFNISPHTVRSHINSAMTKLGAKNKAHAVSKFTLLLDVR